MASDLSRRRYISTSGIITCRSVKIWSSNHSNERASSFSCQCHTIESSTNRKSKFEAFGLSALAVSRAQLLHILLIFHPSLTAHTILTK